MNKNYKIHIENYATIHDLELDLSPGVQGFVGKNAQGKTNILRAIQELLDGKNDPSKIRDGQEKYVVRLSVYNADGEVEATITRTQTKTASKLDAKGLPMGYTASIYLARLLDSRMLNPLRLITENPVDYLKKHLPAVLKDEDLPADAKIIQNFDEVRKRVGSNGFEFCEAMADYLGTARKVAHKRAQDASGVVADLEVGLPAETPPKPHDEEQVKAAIEELKRDEMQIEFLAKQHREHKEEADRLGRICHKLDDELKKMDEQIETLMRERATRMAEHNLYAKQHADKLMAMHAVKVPDASQIQMKIREEQAKLAALSNWNEAIRRFQRLEERRVELAKAKAEHKRFDELFKLFKYDLPKRLIERANLPVDGIEFRDSDLFVDGRRIDLLSETERAIVATKLAVGLAKAKGHLAISLDGVEIMDPEHREQWLSVAKGSGLKVFYTRQGAPEGAHELEIVDGQVQ